MRGRYPAGWEYLDKFEASAEAKERVRLTMEILSGACRVGEACARLGIGSTRLEQVRAAIVAAALDGAERQRPGRKPVRLSPCRHDRKVRGARCKKSAVPPHGQPAWCKSPPASTT